LFWVIFSPAGKIFFGDPSFSKDSQPETEATMTREDHSQPEPAICDTNNSAQPINIYFTLQESNIMQAEPTHAEIKDQVIQLKDALAKEDSPKLQSLMKDIQKEGKVQHVVDFVAPLLFQKVATSGDSITCDEALSLVSCLVHSDSSNYLKPVSRAVLRASSSEKPLYVSEELMSVIISRKLLF
jgi:hypothetical protein